MQVIYFSISYGESILFCCGMIGNLLKVSVEKVRFSFLFFFEKSCTKER